MRGAAAGARAAPQGRRRRRQPRRGARAKQQRPQGASWDSEKQLTCRRRCWGAPGRSQSSPWTGPASKKVGSGSGEHAARRQGQGRAGPARQAPMRALAPAAAGPPAPPRPPTLLAPARGCRCPLSAPPLGAGSARVPRRRRRRRRSTRAPRTPWLRARGTLAPSSAARTQASGTCGAGCPVGARGGRGVGEGRHQQGRGSEQGERGSVEAHSSSQPRLWHTDLFSSGVRVSGSTVDRSRCAWIAARSYTCCPWRVEEAGRVMGRQMHLACTWSTAARAQVAGVVCRLRPASAHMASRS